MAVSLLTRWLAHNDPIHWGWTPAGITAGSPVVCGLHWARLAGGYILYRAALGSTGQPDTANAVECGATSPTATTPTSIRPTSSQGASCVRAYWIHAASPGGAIESQPFDWHAVETDGAGAPVSAAPSAPFNLRVVPLAGGYLMASWKHNRETGTPKPVAFNVYSDSGTGTMDWVTPEATVTGHTARIGTFTHGKTVAVGVRAESAAGTEDSNQVTRSATADSEGPPDAPAPVVTEGTET